MHQDNRLDLKKQKLGKIILFPYLNKEENIIKYKTRVKKMEEWQGKIEAHLISFDEKLFEQVLMIFSTTTRHTHINLDSILRKKYNDFGMNFNIYLATLYIRRIFDNIHKKES